MFSGCLFLVHTWTSKSGKFTVRAELLSFDQGVVSLRRDVLTLEQHNLADFLLVQMEGEAATVQAASNDDEIGWDGHGVRLLCF